MERYRLIKMEQGLEELKIGDIFLLLKIVSWDGVALIINEKTKQQYYISKNLLETNFEKL